MSDPVAAKLAQLVAPGAEVIITAGEPASLLGTALGDRLLVPLRAIAHIRKSGLVIENLEAYLRSEEHTSELQSLMRISYAVFCLKKKKNIQRRTRTREHER